MQVTHKITAHLDSDRGYHPIDVVQSDTARVVAVSLYEGSTAWTIPAGAAVLVRFRKSDGTGGTYDTLPNGSRAYSISGNTVTVTLAPQVLTVPGRTELQVAIVAGKDVLSTFTVILRVQADPSIGTVPSEDYTNLGEWILPQAIEAAEKAMDAATTATAAATRAAEAAAKAETLAKSVTSRMDLAFEPGSINTSTGVDSTGTQYEKVRIRSGYFPVLGETLSITAPLTVRTRLVYYDENLAFCGSSPEFKAGFYDVAPRGAFTRLIVGYENDAEVTDANMLASMVSVYFPSQDSGGVGGAFYVTVRSHTNGTYAADKTFDELTEAYYLGHSLYCRLESNDYILPLAGMHDSSCLFSGVIGKESYRVTISQESVSVTLTDLQGSVAVQGGLTSEAKAALMALVENIGLWANGDGQAYIDALRTALYDAPIMSISAVYVQTRTIYASDDLETLRSDLTVTAIYTDGTSSVLTDYTLSGILTAGTSVITAAKNGKTATFEVNVAAQRVEATGITLDNTALSLTSKKPIQLVATVTPENTTDNVVWKSSEEAVAKVDVGGMVTPVADGSCVISATAGDHTAECFVKVSLPLTGLNIGNPYLTKVSGEPASDEAAQNKWFSTGYGALGAAIGTYDLNLFYHPLTEGAYYIRMLHNSLAHNIKFYAFDHADIVSNPTPSLGILGDTYKDGSVEFITSFDWVDKDGNAVSGHCNLGEYEYVDGSGSTYGDCFVILCKVTVPKDVYVFMTKYNATKSVGMSPGISADYPLNDLYTIFDSDPSRNILQTVE